jgi:HD-like signal output (HDOD) protein
MLIAAVVVIAFVWWMFRRPAASAARPLPVAVDAPRPAAQRRASAAPASAAPAQATARMPTEARPLPTELAAFVWKREADLEPERRDTLLAAVRGIPRPPRSMQQLLSPEFLASASSADLSELVMGEPLIAAKVLATVNGSFYGLQKPVTSIGQAVTFLGINTVRSICLQYMLAEAFKPKLAEAQQAFDRIWKASAIAGEMAVRLGKALHLPDQSSLSTQVVLGFVGQLATASLIPPAGLAQWLGRDRLERARLEQELLGLSASEVGAVLMKSWELPDSLVADVADSGRLLVTEPQSIDTARLPRLALAYLCARLGERLAMGQLTSLNDYFPQDDAAVDTHHLRAALTHPALAAKLDAALQAPELQAAVKQMIGQASAG